MIDYSAPRTHTVRHFSTLPPLQLHFRHWDTEFCPKDLFHFSCKSQLFTLLTLYFMYNRLCILYFYTKHVCVCVCSRCSPTELPSSSTSSTERCRYSTVKLSIRGCRSTMCRDEALTGQKPEAEVDGGDEEEDEEEGGGTASPAAALAASDWLRGPYMLA